MLTEEDFFTNKDFLKDLDKIKRRYNIEIDDEFFNSDQQLFKSFMSMNPRAFFSFKNNANISRTLAKNHFKAPIKTGIDKRKEEVFKIFNKYQKNLLTIKRLELELEELKPVNKALHRIHKKSLNQVI